VWRSRACADSHLLRCRRRYRLKEDALKALERALVEVLVDQQKKLLKTLTDAGQSRAKYLKAKQKQQQIAEMDL